MCIYIKQANRTNIPCYHAKRLGSALRIICFLLPSCFTCNECLNCSCYYCHKCCCYRSYCIVSLFASYPDFLSTDFRSLYLFLIRRMFSLNARVILSSSHSLHPHLSISLRSLPSLSNGSHPKLFPNLSSSGDLYASCEFEDRSKSIISSGHVSSFQSVNRQRALILKIAMQFHTIDISAQL